ncbi:hypothetical protein MSG28_012560 [Choristoneura fumiferana]|uniref:Uncharacterized protein n=1 Tax=Choristoneura fumiferana TaxID=7141 RepID=A0ACC0JH46_CHOFU|nr:hypothetical protein MSG28_012560 [Choristoneura fumiferana]
MVVYVVAIKIFRSGQALPPSYEQATGVKHPAYNPTRRTSGGGGGGVVPAGDWRIARNTFQGFADITGIFVEII